MIFYTKNKLARAAAALLTAALMLASCSRIEESVPVAATAASETSASSETSVTTEATTVTTQPPERVETVSFTATGDNLIHSSIYKQAAERSESGGYDFIYAYSDIAELVAEADIAVINQETLICNDLFEPSTYPCFNSPTALGDCMIDMGFDVFTMANNHVFDKGEEGLSACLDYWDGKDVVSVGAYRNAEDKQNIRTNEVNGIKFAYLAYTESTNGLTMSDGCDMTVGDALDIDGMKSDVERASELADVCVVSLHWGVENSDVITDYQRQTAKILSDAGADIIIGNHPHVLRDIEMIRRDDGTETLCAYSLGNLISAQSVGQNLIGGILRFNVNMRFKGEDILDCEPEITDIRLIPIVTQYEGDYRDVRIYRLENYTRELAAAHGVNTRSLFGYDYIFDVLEKNVDEKYLELPERQPERAA